MFLLHPRDITGAGEIYLPAW